MDGLSALAEYSMELPPGTLIGQYRIIRVLGKPGGFGITYLAHDENLDTPIAIKEFLPRDLVMRASDRSTVVPYTPEDAGRFRQGLDQFVREARTLAKINHPNVVRVRTFCEAHGTAYLVMDYYEGQTLDELLASRPERRLPYEKAVAIIDYVLDGLRASHAVHILHRDVKPTNIYITTKGVPVLLDFGAARQALNASGRMTAVLTHGFAPLEQYGERGQGTWSDVYAAAAVLYTMLTGVTPVRAPDRTDEDPLRAPKEVVPEIPQPLSDAIMHGLAVQAQNRPKTAEEFQELISVASTVIDGPKRNYKQLVAALIAASAVVGIGIWQFRGTLPASSVTVDTVTHRPIERTAVVGVPTPSRQDSVADVEQQARPQRRRESSPPLGIAATSRQEKDRIQQQPVTQRAVRDSIAAKVRFDSIAAAVRSDSIAAQAAREIAERQRRDSVAAEEQRHAAIAAERRRDSVARAERLRIEAESVTAAAASSRAARERAWNTLDAELGALAERLTRAILRGSVGDIANSEGVAKFVRLNTPQSAGPFTVSRGGQTDNSSMATILVPLKWKSGAGAWRSDVVELLVKMDFRSNTWRMASARVVRSP